MSYFLQSRTSWRYRFQRSRPQETPSLQCRIDQVGTGRSPSPSRSGEVDPERPESEGLLAAFVFTGIDFLDCIHVFKGKCIAFGLIGEFK